MGHFRAGTDAEVSDGIGDAYDYYNTEGPEGENVKNSSEDSREKIEAKQYIEVDTKPDSYTVLVNRDYLISKDYVPDDLVVPEVPFSFYGTYEKLYAEACSQSFGAFICRRKDRRLYFKGRFGVPFL